MQLQQQKQKYQIPRFHDLALVVLSYGMFEVTARQLVLLMLCGLVALNLYPHLPGLPLVARVIVSGLPSFLILPFGWFSLWGRPLESWLLVLLRYWLEPRLYTWPHLQQRRSMPAAASVAARKREKR